MSDLAAVILAATAAAGALVAWPVPVVLAGAVVVVGWIGRSAVVLVVGTGLLTAGLSARSWAGLHPPRQGPFAGVVSLASDPASAASGEVKVDVRIGGKRVEAWAHGRTARLLAPRLAGERVAVRGRLAPVPPGARARLASRHVAARLSIDAVGAWAPGDLASRLANGVRRTLAEGARPLSPSHRSLFLGFVLGDDRGQTPEVVEDFRGSGLAHLLVVSGENVAFVLALVAPFLRRMAMVGRIAAAVAVLLFFGVLTRWEPSVLRAIAMVAASLAAWAMGRPVSRLRLLALAVAGLLVIDPLLVHSVGFLLSVGACAGIAVLAPPLADLLPGPGVLAGPLAVTMAAQLGVAPVLVPVFGGVPVASLPANLLALPAAGPVMMWGLAAGLPAGLAGGAAARLVDVPTGLLIGWIAGVARWGAAAPLGQLHAVHVLVLGALAVLGCLAPNRRSRLALLTASAVVIAQPAIALHSVPQAWGKPLVPGVRVWRSSQTTVLVAGDVRPDQLLRAVHGAGVRRIDLLVVTSAGRRPAEAARTLLARVPARALAVPARSPLGGTPGVVTGGRVEVPPFAVEVRPGARGIEATVKRR